MKKPFMFTLMYLTLSVVTAHAGNEMGNGADNFAGDYGTAWFVGEDRKVTFCIDADPRFGRTLDQARNDIQAAWKKWLDYVAVKGLYGNTLPPTFKYPKFISERACDGKEDIRFRLGTEDAEVKQEKTHYNRPSAISYRQSFDQSMGWGKGWIWFCMPGAADPDRHFPEWGSDLVFQSILLHEIGHVLGNVHVGGTIMDHGLSQKLPNREIKSEWTGKIDHTKALLAGGVGPDKTSGYLGGSGYFNPYRAFEWLTGKKPVGTIVAEYRKVSDMGQMELEVKDDKGAQSFSFSVKPTLNGPDYSSDVPVFKRMREKSSVWTHSQGGVKFGTLRHPTLGDVTVLYEMNMSSLGAIGPFGIKVLIDGLPQPLFAGFPEH